MKKLIIISSLFLTPLLWRLSGPNAFAQNKNVDSLQILLKKDKEDTNKINHANNLCREYINIGLYDTALHFSNYVLQLSQQLKFKKGIANSYNNIGIVYMYQGNYPRALDYYFDALKIDEEIGNKNGIAKRLGNIGVVYYKQGNYHKALDCYFKTLKAFEELGDKNKFALTLGNIGNIYFDQGDFAKALEYYFKALKIDEELGDKNKIASQLGNIGIVYRNQGNYSKALDYFFKGLKIFEELRNKNHVAASLGNIGLVYWNQGNYPKALDYYFKALKMAEELGEKNAIAADLGNLGSLYTRTGKFKEAENYLRRAIAMDDSIGAMDFLRINEERLSQLFDTTGRHKEALIHYKKAIAIKDTIFSQENKKELVRKEMKYEFDKKEAITKAENEKQQAIAEEKNRRQKIITLSVALGLLLVLIFAGFVFRSLRITRKQKNIIELQKNEVSQQKGIVEKQKRLVEEHQKEIIDSITYAKRLQEAILPPTAYVNLLLPDNFILYKPKDIVAGDFYWMEVVKSFEPGKGDIVLIAAADCTGHGVPGAMVSMVCSNALNRAVKEFHLLDTGKILDKATDLVLETFEKSDKDVKDGMDISLLRIEFAPFPSGMKVVGLQWSGANNPLWYISSSPTGDSQSEICEITADKQPIGKQDSRKPFITHNIERSALNLKSESVFYLFTDGYADQFGGPKGKKFMYKQFKELLLSIHHLPMNEQQCVLEKTINDWSGKLEQVDDILVIGIRV